MQRLTGEKKKRDCYSACLAALGSQCSRAGSAVAQLATPARSTTLGLSVMVAGTQTPAQVGCMDMGRGQHRVLALGRAPRAASA